MDRDCSDDDSDVSREGSDDFHEAAAEIAKRVFCALSEGDESMKISALTKICNLGFGPQGLETRVELAKRSAHLYIAKLLDSSDVLVQCKGANAMGSLLAAPEAATIIITALRGTLTSRLIAMVMTDNTYAQGDALFALGWAVSSGLNLDELLPSIGERAGNLFSDSLAAGHMTESQRNLRVFSLVFLHKVATLVNVPVCRDLITHMLQSRILEALMQVLALPSQQDDLLLLTLNLLLVLTLHGKHVTQALLDGHVMAPLLHFQSTVLDAPYNKQGSDGE
eukprot:Ihof_evm4s82 gene=Ihof_evmTU4s82